MRIRDLSKLSGEDFREFIQSFDYAVANFDDALWNDNSPILGPKKFYKLLNKLNKKIFFICDDSLKSDMELLRSFKTTGYDFVTNMDNVMHPSKAIGIYLKAMNFRRKIFPLICPTGIAHLEKSGFFFFESTIDEEASVDARVGAVVVDCDYRFDFRKLRQALTYLERPEVHFIIGASDPPNAQRRSAKALRPTCFNKVIQELSGREPVVFGKLSPQMAIILKKYMKVKNPSKVLYIGKMDDELSFAKSAGFATLKVFDRRSRNLSLTKGENISSDYLIGSYDDFLIKFDTTINKLFEK